MSAPALSAKFSITITAAAHTYLTHIILGTSNLCYDPRLSHIYLCDTKETTKINLEANFVGNLARQCYKYFIIII